MENFQPLMSRYVTTYSSAVFRVGGGMFIDTWKLIKIKGNFGTVLNPSVYWRSNERNRSKHSSIRSFYMPPYRMQSKSWNIYRVAVEQARVEHAPGTAVKLLIKLFILILARLHCVWKSHEMRTPRTSWTARGQEREKPNAPIKMPYYRSKLKSVSALRKGISKQLQDSINSHMLNDTKT